MARKTSTSTPDATSTETVENPTVETPVEGTETPATEAPEADAPIDTSAFEAVVAEVVATRDESTGVVAAEEVAKVTTAYRNLDGTKPKNQAKKHVEEAMLAAVGEVDGPLARAYSLVKAGMTAGSGGSKSPATPVDPTAAQVAKEASLTLALQIVQGNRPDGFDESKVAEAVTGSADQVQAFATHLALPAPAEGEEAPEAPEVSPTVRAAFKLATGKASGGGTRTGGTSSGIRRDVAKHITEAFADKASGEELTIAEIANFSSTEYGDDKPSQGAVSARLFPESGKPTTVQGVVPIEKAGDKPRRAAKA